MKILLLSGSFRKNSFNTTLLDSAEKLLGNTDTSRFAIEKLPFYDQEQDGDKRPAVVQDFIQAVTDADAVLIATPEYNYSIPAVLKNALDWASRPAFQSCLKGKKIAIVSASPAITGGVQAQAHLKHVLLACLSSIYPTPSCCFGQSHTVMEDGQIIDEETQKRLKDYLEGFSRWVETGES